MMEIKLCIYKKRKAYHLASYGVLKELAKYIQQRSIYSLPTDTFYINFTVFTVHRNMQSVYFYTLSPNNNLCTKPVQ
jgi:hypothetical protein